MLNILNQHYSINFHPNIIKNESYIDAMFKMFDPNYLFASSNPSTIPKTTLDYMDPVSNFGTVVLVYMDVVKVTTLNMADRPCVENTEDYSWTECTRMFVNKGAIPEED